MTDHATEQVRLEVGKAAVELTFVVDMNGGEAKPEVFTSLEPTGEALAHFSHEELVGLFAKAMSTSADRLVDQFESGDMQLIGVEDDEEE